MVAGAHGKGGSTKAPRAARDSKTGGNHEHRHAEFRLPKRSEDTVVTALRGLTGPQRARVMNAIQVVAADVREQGERFVERNVIGNANELLAAMTDRYAAQDRWAELRALWTFLAHLDVPVNHARIARQLETTAGKGVASRYEQVAREMKPVA